MTFPSACLRFFGEMQYVLTLRESESTRATDRKDVVTRFIQIELIDDRS